MDGSNDDNRLAAAYIRAFKRSEQPSEGVHEATWTAIATEVGRRSRTPWVIATLVAAAAVVALTAVRWGEYASELAERLRSQAMHGEDSDTAGKLVERREPHRERAPSEPVARPQHGLAENDSAAAVETSVTPEPRVKRRTRGRTSAAAEKEVVAEPRPSELAAETDEPSEPTAERTSMLLEETALIRRIQAALQDGDSERALELALAHQRRFANGAFVDERTAAHAEALCALGRRHEARALAATFLRRKPDSHLSARVRAVCRIVAN